MSDSSSPMVPHELHEALLKYAATPGKYSAKLRQPALLFAGATEVLQLAAQRNPSTDSHAASLARAARFFVLTALLHPDADHHAILGVEEGAAASLVKERYRLLMRLLHPDFASAQAAWPDDAAARVNRAYEYVSSGGKGTQAAAARVSVVATERPARAAPVRPPAPAAGWILPKSRLKHAFILLGVIGFFLMLLVLGSDRQGPVQLVQKPPAPSTREIDRGQPPPPSLGAKLGDLLADVTQSRSLLMSTELGSTPEPRPPAVVRPLPAPEKVLPPAVQRDAAPVQRSANPAPPAREDPPPPAARPMGTPAPAERNELAADLPAPPAPGSPAVNVSEPVRNVASAAPTRADPASPVSVAPTLAPPSAPRTGLTLAEAQPLLLVLLQYMESGRGDRMLSLLEPEARTRPAAQAFTRQYDHMVDGARVRISQVQFRAEPAEGKLVVVGQMRVSIGDQPIGMLGRKFTLQAEFVQRNGAVALTGLSGGPY